MTTLQQQTKEAAILNHPLCTVPGFKEGALFGINWERDRDRWIKVEDQLPEEDREKPGYSIGVWATDGEMQFTCRYYFPAGKWIAAFKKVTHWQPMPQPPKV